MSKISHNGKTHGNANMPTKNRSVKQRSQVRDYNHTREGEREYKPSVAEVAEEKPRYKVQPVYQVVKAARALFYSQLTKDGEVKKKSLEFALAKNGKIYPDQERFWIDYRAERELLVDSKRFCTDCSSVGLPPETVADHVVFEGKSIVNAALRNGVLTILGDKVRMFKTPLWEDNSNLFSSKDKKEAADNE